MVKEILIKAMEVIKILIEILTEMRRETHMKELIKTHILIKIPMEILMGILLGGKATKITKMPITKHIKESVKDIKRDNKCIASIIKRRIKWLKKNLII